MVTTVTTDSIRRAPGSQPWLRMLGAFMFTLLVTGTGLLASPQAAFAGTTDCGLRISDADHWPDRKSAPLRTTEYHGRTAQLIQWRRSDWSWGEIRGYRSGDRVWVDRKKRGTSRWSQCGPFNRSQSRAQWNIGYDMRACMNVDGVTRCTGWYHDKS